MRVIEYESGKEYEVGLFGEASVGGAMKLRLLELPLRLGQLGPDAGFVVLWPDYGEGGQCTFDTQAELFFDPDPNNPIDDMLCGPEAALKVLILASRRFKFAATPDNRVPQKCGGTGRLAWQPRLGKLGA